MSNLSSGTHVAEPSANKDCRKLLNQFCRFLPKLKLPISADAKLPLTDDDGNRSYKTGNVFLGGGIGVDFKKMVRVNVSYDLGLVNRSTADNTRLTENLLSVGVAFLF